jgi:hypothetical protein
LPAPAFSSGQHKQTAETLDTPLLGVTCDHVVQGVLGTNALLYLGFDTMNGYSNVPAKVLFSDPTNDISVIGFADGTGDPDTLKRLSFSDDVLSLSQLDSSSNSVVVGRGVLTAGYPLKIGLSTSGNNPIVRFGMIAQDSNAGAFLIDGTFSRGNSGSLVQILSPDGKICIVGMLNSFLDDRAQVRDNNDNVVGNFAYNSGLSIAIKSSLIVSAVQAASSHLK